MKNIITKSFLIIMLSLISCSGGNDNSVSEENNIPEPEAAILTKPANNSECLEVEAVKFEWSTSKNTTSYDIVVKNLSNDVKTSQTTTSNSVEISLEKGFPYSWQIISKNEGSVTKISSTWKFYLSGTPLKNHAPFPAEIITPKPGEAIVKGTIELSWTFSDVDSSDTHTFDIYLDNQNASTKIESDYSNTKKSISLNQAGTYYWRIVTKDNHGSTSNSGISSFILID
tara:strand:+ start:246 stop:929 length:684 start_codon:yes stop_codon:yes gene_type:complete